MSQLTFRGAFLRFADLRHKKEAGVFARLHFTADLTKPVMEAMEWAEIPDCMNSAKLCGLLTARNLVLTPNQKELRKSEIQLDCNEVGDFQLFRVQDKDDKDSTRTELRFVARVVARGAIAVCEEYLRTVGTSQGALKIAYEDQGELAIEEKPAGKTKTNGTAQLDMKQRQAGEKESSVANYPD